MNDHASKHFSNFRHSERSEETRWMFAPRKRGGNSTGFFAAL
jgi:hypothetical protein